MSARSPILVIEDDPDDARLITDAISELGISNPVRHFSSGTEALAYLLTTADQPLIILCDVKMPGLNGLSLLKNIVENAYLRDKAIPFVFLTMLDDKEIVKEAYHLCVQGYFRKANSYQALKEQLLSILVYWRAALHPNTSSLSY